MTLSSRLRSSTAKALQSSITGRVLRRVPLFNLFDRGVMMVLRLAPTTIVRLDLGDGDWLDVREDISRARFNQLISTLPSNLNDENVTVGVATDFARGLF